LKESTSNLSQKSYFRKLIFLIEEYLLHDFIYSNPQTFSKVTQGDYSSSLAHFYQTKTQKRMEFTSKKVPSPHIHYAIYLTVHYLQKIISPFAESGQPVHFLLGLSTEDARSKYSKLIYGYIINSLKYWTKDLNNCCNLADLGCVWVKYLKPWEVNLWDMRIRDLIISIDSKFKFD